MLRTGLLLMRGPAMLLAALVCAGCQEERPAVDAAWFAAEHWNAGDAVVSVYRGTVVHYGEPRAAEIRRYVIREWLDPDELTKRDGPGEGRIPVLKVNRLLTYDTGTYQYRRMSTLFFDRRDGSLVKATGSSQEGCGIAFQRWDRSGVHRWDTYWEGEGAGSRKLPKGSAVLFRDELPVLAPRLVDGAVVTVLPSLTRNNLRGRTDEGVALARDGRTVRAGDGWFRYDDGGFLEAWEYGGETFERVLKKRLFYWQHTDPGDERLITPEAR